MLWILYISVRLSNPKKVTIGHLNINSIPNKFNGIMSVVKDNLDIFLISETKIDPSFPEAQFCFPGYGIPHRKDRCIGGGGLLMYVNEDIPSRQLKTHILPNNIEILCVEINLKKQKWCILGIYRPPNMDLKYFMDNLSKVVDYYSSKYDNIIIMGDFNAEPSDDNLVTLVSSYNLYNFVKESTCFKGPPKCYDLILSNRKHNFIQTKCIFTGFSDFHKMTFTVLKTEFTKADPIKMSYRNYKNYNRSDFYAALRTSLHSDTRSFVDYNTFQIRLCEILDKHASIKTKYLRANNSPFMSKQLRKMIMTRSRSKNAYYKNKTVENWKKYRIIRNQCVKMVKKVKREYFQN